MFEEWENFGIKIGPVEVGGMSQSIRYTKTEKSIILRIKIEPEIKREQIKARLIQPGLLEIEWPRAKGEEIPVE